jgi:hypothetical protein
MKSINKLFVVLLIIPCLQFWACQSHNEEQDFEHPSVVEDIAGTDLASVTLTEKAIERIGLQTALVDEINHSPNRLVVPYSSIIYDQNGQVWVYTSPEPRTFVRHKVDVDFIEGDKVFLNEGPPVGTVIATVAVAELYGTELNIGH